VEDIKLKNWLLSLREFNGFVGLNPPKKGGF